MEGGGMRGRLVGILYIFIYEYKYILYILMINEHAKFKKMELTAASQQILAACHSAFVGFVPFVT